MASVALETLPQPRKLRVALFADARLQPRWIVEAFVDVARSDCAEIVLISVAEGATPAAGWRERIFAGSERLDLSAHVPHKRLLAIPQAQLLQKIVRNGCVIDIKAALDAEALRAAGLRVWRL